MTRERKKKEVIYSNTMPPRGKKDFVIWFLKHQDVPQDWDELRVMVEDAIRSYEEA